MKKCLFVVLMFAVAACSSVPIPQPNLTGTASSSSGNPQSTLAIPYPPADAARSSPTPPAWSSLGLTGSLVLILHAQAGIDIARMDLTNGQISPIFHAPDGALMSTALVSPDQKQILLSYAPPATASNTVSYTSLYLLPMDGSGTLKPLLPAPKDEEADFAPVWAPDGKSVYTSHFIRGSQDGSTPDQYSIDQVTLAGETKQILTKAMWPSLSPDGSKLSYVTALGNTGQNDLYLADSSGANPTPPLKPGTFLAVDDHFFTPDGKAIIFSAVNPQPTPSPTVWDRLFGIQVVSAHNVPSDWYQVPVGGGQVQRLTNLNDTGMYATLSPDGKRIAFISQTGIYVMNIDGTELTQLAQLVATGTVDWIP
ncbi:MAG: DPP IV N-terminal domain-containing protein [Anaerolineaceae bacterium]|nr:DPP IV N-terminal domain-containing protein [Anaerolineaceae bacterium]